MRNWSNSSAHISTRAHRRFLGLALPLPSPDETATTLQTIEFAPGSRRLFAQHLATAGEPRGGVLLGHRQGDTLRVEVILGAGHPWPAPSDPLQADARYLLGALDAAQQVSPHPLNWIGSWIMAADGRAMKEAADLHWWRRARRRALVSEQAILVTIGHSPERLVVRAWVEDDDQPRALNVVWAASGGTP